MRLFFLVIFVFGMLQADFTRVDDIVIDNENGLEWQDDNEVGRITKRKWIDAINYCEELTLGGKRDWRLPNQNELLSIVDYTSPEFPIASVFLYTNAEPYWSSTSFIGNLADAWYVDFSFGEALTEHKNIELFVRCVRGGE